MPWEYSDREWIRKLAGEDGKAYMSNCLFTEVGSVFSQLTMEDARLHALAGLFHAECLLCPLDARIGVADPDRSLLRRNA